MLLSQRLKLLVGRSLLILSMILAAPFASAGLIDDLLKFQIKAMIVTPGDHQAFIDVINAPTTKTIKMSMFHLSDPAVIQAFIDRGKKGDCQIQIILDRDHMTNPSDLQTALSLQAAGIDVRASSDVFSITHTKYMLVNDDEWWVTSINLTTQAEVTRDLGIVGNDPAIFAEMLSVFVMDLANGDSDLVAVSKEPGHAPDPTVDLSKYSPPFKVANLVWSPLESAAKIVELIDSAQKSIILTVENFRFQAIQDALVNAKARGVDVKVIMPQVDQNSDPNFDLMAAYEMLGVKVGAKSVSVNSRLMPGPPTAQTPYMHLKMVSVDDEVTYIGSENFSTNSLQFARELGIIFRDNVISGRIKKIFQQDWAVTVSLPPKKVGQTLVEESELNQCASLF